MPEVFIEAALGIAHEIVSFSGPVPVRIHVRCQAPFPPQFGLGNVGEGPITCMACIGWVDVEYVTSCQYCAMQTGTTPYPWATEDICDACSALTEETGA